MEREQFLGMMGNGTMRPGRGADGRIRVSGGGTTVVDDGFGVVVVERYRSGFGDPEGLLRFISEFVGSTSLKSAGRGRSSGSSFRGEETPPGLNSPTPRKSKSVRNL